jgi:ABC-type transport system involved in multi-copper enzyme maturation permease subunit
MIRVLTIAKVVWLEMLRRKDLYVLTILLLAMVTYLVSIDVFGEMNASRYVAEIGFTLTWLFSWILTINLAARQLPAEERSGTVFPLLAKPVTRRQLIGGKWAGAWLACLGATAFFYLVTTVVVSVRGGELVLDATLQAFILHACMLSIITAMAVAFTTRLGQAAATTLCYILTGVSFLLVPRIPETMTTAQGFGDFVVTMAYFGLPNFELFDMRRRLVHGWGPAPWLAFAASVGYAVLWSAIFLGLANLGYRRKFFRRGNLA